MRIKAAFTVLLFFGPLGGRKTPQQADKNDLDSKSESKCSVKPKQQGGRAAELEIIFCRSVSENDPISHYRTVTSFYSLFIKDIIRKPFDVHVN